MKINLLIIIGLMMPFYSLAQISPGGVEGVSVWYASIIDDKGAIQWMNHQSGKVEQIRKANDLHPTSSNSINFNPTWYFDGQSNGLEFSIDSINLSKQSVFTIYQSEYTEVESPIWSLKKDSLNHLLNTTHRFADLAEANYMNFHLNRDGFPKLNSYFQSKSNEPIHSEYSTLQVGFQNSSQQLPVQGFIGKLPELIIFNRVLNQTERLQVESYLALKYGITFNTEGNPTYLNSNAEIIWDGIKYASYSNHIAGIGRDDKSGLYQKQATSSTENQLISIGLGQVANSNFDNKNAISNNTFLVWGNNKGQLSFKGNLNEPLRKLQRQWTMSANGNIDSVQTEVVFDIRKTIDHLKADETYWLVIDRSGQGEFTMQNAAYFPLSNPLSKGKAVFQNILWDIDRSGTDLFTLAIGPKILPITALQYPSCKPQKMGAIAMSILGGEAPYKVYLSGENLTPITNTIEDREQIVTIKNIPSGTYTIIIEDSKGYITETPIHLQASDAPNLVLEAIYEIDKGKPLYLDASTNLSHLQSYQWNGPNGFNQRKPNVAIEEPGTYNLTIEQEGCISQQRIQIISTSNSALQNVKIFPNPTLNGQFELSIFLSQTMPVDIEILDVLGRTITKQQMKGSDFYTYKGKINEKGQYLVRLKASGQSHTLKLISE